MAFCLFPVGDNPRGNGGQGISVEEFKKWLMSYDLNRDGRISKAELREAMRSRGVRFCWLKSGREMKSADVDGNGYIEKDEIENLLSFAENKLGFKFC